MGIEADAQYTDVNGSDTASVPDDLFDSEFNARQELRFLSTVRGRLGFAPMEALFVFGTAGLAIGEVKYNANLINGSTPDDEWPLSDSHTEMGWTAGGGFEVAVSDEVSLKAEYLFVDFGKETFDAAGTFDANEFVTYTFENEYHLIRAGLNWHF